LILEKAPAKTGVTKGIDLPKTSQLVRGGFGVKGSEKGLFLGGGQKVATSQIGLFKPGKEIKLTREFFVTPQEPTLKIPTTRISRLGLSDLFKFNKQSQISFGLPGSPQIAVESGAKITRAGKGTSFKIGTGSELEAIKSSTILTNIKKVGVTSIRGQKVDLFTFKSAPGGKISSSISMTTQPLTRVSGEVTLATALKSNGVKLVSATTTQPITTATFSTTIPTLPKIFSTLTRQPSRRSPPRSPPISRIITPPTTTILKSFKSPPITTPFQPTITRTRRSPPIIPRTPTFAPPTFKGGRFPKQRIKKYPTLVRRFGKWKTIALSKTPQKAIFKGQRYSKQTLGRSFYVPGSKTLVLPGFRTKKEKGIGKIYIQKTGKGRTSTLGSFGERREIKLFQGLSPKKKTRKRRKKK